MDDKAISYKPTIIRIKNNSSKLLHGGRQMEEQTFQAEYNQEAYKQEVNSLIHDHLMKIWNYCPFCETLRQRKELDAHMLQNEEAANMFDIMYFAEIKRVVHYDGNLCGVVSEGPFDLNFCPRCGRDLHEDPIKESDGISFTVELRE